MTWLGDPWHYFQFTCGPRLAGNREGSSFGTCARRRDEVHTVSHVIVRSSLLTERPYFFLKNLINLEMNQNVYSSNGRCEWRLLFYLFCRRRLFLHLNRRSSFLKNGIIRNRKLSLWVTCTMYVNTRMRFPSFENQRGKFRKKSENPNMEYVFLIKTYIRSWIHDVISWWRDTYSWELWEFLWAGRPQRFLKWMLRLG